MNGPSPLDMDAANGPSPLDMDPETMRRLGHRVVDLLVERWTGLRADVAWRGAPRTELEPLLREPAPEDGSPGEAVVERAVREVLTTAGRIDHPRFFAFVPSSPTWPAVLGDALATGYNIFQGTWLESAGPSQIELVVLDWFREWTGMPEGSSGLLTSGGSAANLGALVTAREAAGARAESAVVYLSDQGHSSLERAARIMGVPAGNVRKLPTDDRFRLVPDAVARAIAQDRERGLVPVVVCASAGATSTGAVDPLPELAAVCRDAGVWYHVDGAYGGFAALTDRGTDALRGMAEADSLTLDPHKWLYQPYECGCLMVRDPHRLRAAFHILPDYLQDTALGLEHVNFADYGVQLTRRFRALDVWMTVQTFGVAALRAAIDRTLDLTVAADAWIRSSARLELMSGASLGVVCFRYRPAGAWEDTKLDALNAGIQNQIIAEGTAMMSSTRLRGRYTLRFCIMNYRTTWDDVRGTLERIETLGAEWSGAWAGGG